MGEVGGAGSSCDALRHVTHHAFAVIADILLRVAREDQKHAT